MAVMRAEGAWAQEPIFSGGINGDVVFLCRFDGLNNATTAVDESSIGATITFNGGAKLTTQYKQFGTASLLCDMSAIDNTGVTVPHNSIYDSLWDGDFTIEMFFRPDFLLSTNTSINTRTETRRTLFMATPLQIVLARTPSGDNYPTPAISVQWTDPSNAVSEVFGAELDIYPMVAASGFYHLALCRASNRMRFFINGALSRTTSARNTVFNFTTIPASVQWTTAAKTDTINGFAIGGRSVITAQNYPCGGEIDSVRIVRGALYGSDAGFTPPGTDYIPTLFTKRFVDTDVFYRPSIDPYTIYAPIMPGWRETDNDDVIYPADINGPGFSPPVFTQGSTIDTGYGSYGETHYGPGFSRYYSTDHSGPPVINWDDFWNFDNGNGYNYFNGYQQSFKPRHTLLIATIMVNAPSQTITMSNFSKTSGGTLVAVDRSGWTIGGSATNSIVTAAWAWRISGRVYDSAASLAYGSSASDFPDFQWQDGAQSALTVAEVLGTNLSDPIGASTIALGTTGSISMSGLTTVGGSSLSLVYGSLSAVFTGSVDEGYNPFQANGVPPFLTFPVPANGPTMPAGYTSLYDGVENDYFDGVNHNSSGVGYGMTFRSFYQNQVPVGSTSNNVVSSVPYIPFPSLFSWAGFLIELTDVG